MPAVKPESPLVIEEILIKWGYNTILYKDEFVCVLDHPGQPKSKPICIPQEVDHSGCISLDAMQQILIDAKLDYFNYFAILKLVKGLEPEKKA